MNQRKHNTKNHPPKNSMGYYGGCVVCCGGVCCVLVFCVFWGCWGCVRIVLKPLLFGLQPLFLCLGVNPCFVWNCGCNGRESGFKLICDGVWFCLVFFGFGG